jgi:hypothetical protein
MRIVQAIEKSPYAAAGGTGIAVLTLNEWAVIIGIAATILTTVCSITFSWYFKHKRFKAFEKYLKDRGKLGEVLDGEFDDPL